VVERHALRGCEGEVGDENNQLAAFEDGIAKAIKELREYKAWVKRKTSMLCETSGVARGA
jgi:cytochrome b